MINIDGLQFGFSNPNTSVSNPVVEEENPFDIDDPFLDDVVEEKESDDKNEPKETAEAVAEAPLQEEVSKSEPELEPTSESESEKETEVESEQEQEETEEAPKKTRKKRASKKEDNTEEKEPEYHQLKFNAQTDMDDFTNKIMPKPDNERWENFKKEIEDDLDKIKFDEKINEGTIRIILPVLNNLYSRVRPLKGELDALLDEVRAKITRQKALNSSGSNAEERARNAFAACENFKIKGQKTPVNLFDGESIINVNRNWVLSVLDRIEFKRSCIVSYLSIMKLEK